MTIEDCIAKIERLDGDSFIQNMIAQANARYILLNTLEERANFPRYTIRDDNLNILAFHYLNLGCSLAENKELERSRAPLETAASILEYVHGASSNKVETSNYYGLIGSLAYYVCFQYSKAFILIGKIEPQSLIAKLISHFLKRNFRVLSNLIYEIVTDPNYSDGIVKDLTDKEANRRINELVIATALDGLIKYLQTGNERILDAAKQKLFALKEIAEIKGDPGVWWVVRLLLLIIDGFTEASLWSVLKNYFDVDSQKLQSYIKSLVYLRPRGIFELFVTQRKSLEKVLNETGDGCIVNIPTSSGKTRIAELAILDVISNDSSNKVLYIAPFRSLAFEIETSLDAIFSNVDISVSHLYGGSLYSKLDQKLIEDSNVVIATPEKSKAMLRGNEDILNQIGLIIIDEGHLIGADQRMVVNEIFYEELRYFVKKNNGKFLILSAVLPNSEDLSEWLTNSKQSVFKDDWRPSDERLGVLEWDGNSVNLNWESKDKERSSFNRKFINKEELPWKKYQKKPHYFPADKNEAVAATAYKLQAFGPVLIFVGLKTSVFVIARAYMKCLGSSPEDFRWKNNNDWKAFQLSCVETYGEESDWLLFARKGILCHNSDLLSDVRLPMERLMRREKPLVIISTSTLGQGVNIGVSTVIFSTFYQGGEQIEARDFWNIAGRAGRAFVDHEGKILVALDASVNTTIRDKNSIRWFRNQIGEYLTKDSINPVESGLLSILKRLMATANDNSIPFETLLQLIAENKLSTNSVLKDIEKDLDWIDDTLLSLHAINTSESLKDNAEWIEDFFTGSLAYIQAQREPELTGENLIDFLKSRVEGIKSRIGLERKTWNSIIKSGLPLNSDLVIEEKIDEFLSEVLIYKESDLEIDAKIDLLEKIENHIIDLPILSDDGDQNSHRDEIRKLWLKGVEMSKILKYDNALDVITKHYSYKIPWIISSIGKKLKIREFDAESELLDELAILVESGLPNLKAIKIHQAGIRSRTAALEISDVFLLLDDSSSIREIKQELLINNDLYIESVSKTSGTWIELLALNSRSKGHMVNKIPRFSFSTREDVDILIARSIDDRQYLFSPDLTFSEEVVGSEIDFSSVNNIPGIYFIRDPEGQMWEMKVDNPYVHIKQT